MRRLAFLLSFLFYFSLSMALTYEEIKQAYYQSYMFEKRGDFQNAIKSLMKVYKYYPTGYTVNLRLGWLYYLAKNYPKSIYHYEKAISVAPYSIEAKLGLTLPYLAEGKFNSVENVCYQILRTDFYNYYGNLRLAYALRKEGKYKLAKKVILKMLTLYPTDTEFLMELALNYIALGEKAKAKRILEDILILEPLNYKARRYLEKLNSSK